MVVSALGLGSLLFWWDYAAVKTQQQVKFLPIPLNPGAEVYGLVPNSAAVANRLVLNPTSVVQQGMPKPSAASDKRVSNPAGVADIRIPPTGGHKAEYQGRKKSSSETIIILDWTGYSPGNLSDIRTGNCLVTRDRSYFNRSKAVVITHRRQYTLESYPKARLSSQRWVWLMDESPYHRHHNRHNYSFASIPNLFNWTMTYRRASDVYIPYGWTKLREKPGPIPSSIGSRSRLVAAVVSNCQSVHNGRYRYIKQLNTTIPVDGFGRCFHKPCRGLKLYFSRTCPQVEDYLFYLAFENSNCREYISEKPFSHGFASGAVPVVMGAPKADYEAITPPNSFIHVDDFKSHEELGKYLLFLSRNKTDYMKYHEWRKRYKTSYRHQYIEGKPVWEALCAALNKDSGEVKLTPDLNQYWTVSDCKR